jgi:hypothetical protein
MTAHQFRVQTSRIENIGALLFSDEQNRKRRGASLLYCTQFMLAPFADL